MAPFALETILGHWGAYAVFLLIGFAFGFVLEIGGFADSPKLAAQFYFKDMTVLKVMFTGIVVAMVLTFIATGLGWLDFNRVYVPPTYLWPGIVGGLIMGVGFIIGGFCPGTSLVAMATLKIDGLFFVLGAMFGIFLFGESVDSFAEFWNSSYMGRFILPELFGLPTGVVVLGVVVMALVMFWGAEQLERIFGGKTPMPLPRFALAVGSPLALLAIGLVLLGQPTSMDRWEQIRAEKEPLLLNREVQIHPGELLSLLEDNQTRVVLLDLRDEADYNLFHLMNARRVQLEELAPLAPTLLAEPANTVTMVMSNDEERATAAWKILVAETVPNVYILEGGVNCWLDVFEGGYPGCATLPVAADDNLRYMFTSASGANHLLADPDPHHFELEYTPKVKLQKKAAVGGGGCG